MARPIECDFCRGEPGELMITVLTDGSTTAVGRECMPSFVMTMVAQYMPDAIADATAADATDTADAATADNAATATPDATTDRKTKPRRRANLTAVTTADLEPQADAN